MVGRLSIVLICLVLIAAWSVGVYFFATTPELIKNFGSVGLSIFVYCIGTILGIPCFLTLIYMIGMGINKLIKWIVIGDHNMAWSEIKEELNESKESQSTKKEKIQILKIKNGNNLSSSKRKKYAIS